MYSMRRSRALPWNRLKFWSRLACLAVVTWWFSTMSISVGGPKVDSSCIDTKFGGTTANVPIEIATFHAGWHSLPMSRWAWILRRELRARTPLPAVYFNWRWSLQRAGYDPGRVHTLGGGVVWGDDEGANWRARVAAYLVFVRTVSPRTIVVSRCPFCSTGHCSLFFKLNSPAT